MSRNYKLALLGMNPVRTWDKALEEDLELYWGQEQLEQKIPLPLQVP
jgi:hypothetical protein